METNETILSGTETVAKPLSAKPVSKKNKPSKSARIENIQGIVFAIIPLVGYCLFTVVPLVIAFMLQFVSMEGFDLGTIAWNNFDNFVQVFSNPEVAPQFWKSFAIDLYFVALHMSTLVVAILTAYILSQLPKVGRILTVLFFIPQICSSVAVTLMWQNMFDINYGIVNSILVGMFGEGARVNWLNETGPFLAVMAIINLWQAPGYGILMYKAAFTNVNQSLYEAARLDGANRWKQLLHITLPAISPTTFYLLIVGINAGMNTFDIVFVLTGGGSGGWQGRYGPDNVGMTTNVCIYQTGLYSNLAAGRGMPVASVMGFVMFIVMFVISFVNFKLQNKWVSYDQ